MRGTRNNGPGDLFLPDRGRKTPRYRRAFALQPQGDLPARTDLQRIGRLRPAALRRADRSRPDRRRQRFPDSAGTRRQGQDASRHRRWHRHEPRRAGRESRHHRALGYPGFHGPVVGRQGRQGKGRQDGRRHGADRPVRRRLLFGLHGRRHRRGDQPPRRLGCRLEMDLGRQGRVHHRRGRTRDQRHHRHPPHQQGGSRVPRGSAHRQHRQDLFRPRRSADPAARSTTRRRL